MDCQPVTVTSPCFCEFVVDQPKGTCSLMCIYMYIFNILIYPKTYISFLVCAVCVYIYICQYMSIYIYKTHIYIYYINQTFFSILFPFSFSSIAGIGELAAPGGQGLSSWSPFTRFTSDLPLGWVRNSRANPNRRA